MYLAPSTSEVNKVFHVVPVSGKSGSPICPMTMHSPSGQTQLSLCKNTAFNGGFCLDSQDPLLSGLFLTVTSGFVFNLLAEKIQGTMKSHVWGYSNLQPASNNMTIYQLALTFERQGTSPGVLSSRPFPSWALQKKEVSVSPGSPQQIQFQILKESIPK